MTSIRDKANHVRSARSDGKHTCHWPGCDKIVPPAMWGCKYHWFRLPRYLRNKIWAAYEPGQEITKDPSEEYLKAADEVEQWIRENAA